jgi:hypothetical protein
MNAGARSGDEERAEYIAFEAFREGLPLGRFHVVVNPELARRFVARRMNMLPLVVAIIGCGVAAALAGHVWGGAALVATGLLLRRLVKWRAPAMLLWLASRQPAAYHDATEQGVMEVQRRVPT